MAELLDKLNRKTRKLADENLAPGEQVQVVVTGSSSQALIATDQRLIILKAGIMSGNTFGGNATSLHYADVTGIEVRTKVMTGWIEVLAPSFQGAEKKYWSSDVNSDPYKAMNCVPFASKGDLKKLAPELEQIRSLIRQHKGAPGVAASASATDDLTAKLERLTALHTSGALSDNEFAQAKQQLLSQA